MNRLLVLFFMLSSLLCAQGRIEPRMLKQAGATTNQILAWNGTIWAPAANESVIGEQDYIDFDNDIAAPSYLEGRLFYDQDSNALAYYNDDENVTLQIGQELWIYVKNETGSTLVDGAAVYVNGAVGASGTPTVALALADSMDTVKQVGVVTANILNNEFGYVTATGIVRGIDTDGLGEGNLLYVSTSVAGDLTATPPVSPNYRAPVAYVVNDHASQGSIFVFRETATIGAATTTDYFRGDESWQTLQADAVAFTPAGSIAATDTQAAVEEVSGDADGHPSASMTFTNKEMNDLSNHIDADATHAAIRNVSGSTLEIGDVVYISGYNIGLDLPQVDLADNDDAAKMPAYCTIETQTLNNATGHCQVSGTLYNSPTSGMTVGDELYVDSTAGDWTTTRPTGASEAVQKIGIVLRVHASLGVVGLIGAGRSNDIPNYIAAASIGNADVDDTELSYVNNVSSAIQTQLNAKEGTLTNSAGLATALSDEVGDAGGFTRGTAGSENDCVKWDASGNLVTTSAVCAVGDVVGPGSATDDAIATYNSTSGKLLQDSVVTVDGDGAIAAGQLNIAADDTFVNEPRIAVIRDNVVAASTGTVISSTFNMSTLMSAETSQNAVFGIVNNNVTTGCIEQDDNCGDADEPHTMGVLGKGEDTAAGNITMYGVEGRVDGKGTDAGHKYVGVIGVSAFEGASIAAPLRGVDSLVTATTDGSTPLATAGSVTTSYYARPVIGGETKWSFFGNDPGYFPSLGLGSAAPATPAVEVDIRGEDEPTLYLIDTTNTVAMAMVSTDTNGTIGTITNHPFSIVVNTAAAINIGTDKSSNFDGVINLNDPGSQPTCDGATRGYLWFDEGTGGVADSLDICAKDGGDSYAWRVIY